MFECLPCDKKCIKIWIALLVILGFSLLFTGFGCPLRTTLYGISPLSRSPGLKSTNLGSGAEKQQAATRRKGEFWRQRWVCYTAGHMTIFTVSNARTFTWSFATKIVMWRSQVYFILDSSGRHLDQYLILVLLLLLGSQISCFSYRVCHGTSTSVNGDSLYGTRWYAPLITSNNLPKYVWRRRKNW
jgi:hypothetical protein